MTVEVRRTVEFAIDIEGVTWRPTGRLRYFKHPRVQDREGEEIPFDFAFVLQQQFWRELPDGRNLEKIWHDVPQVEEQ